MDEYWNNSNIEVQVISPVHIGSGNRHTQLNFIFHDQKITVIDQEKLLEQVGRDERTVNQFISQVERNVSIKDILESCHLSFLDLEAYTITANVFQVPTEVQEFIKDPFSLAPYLPGSSIKGSLRSSLLRGAFLSDNDKRECTDQKVLETIDQVNSYRRTPSASGDIEAEIFVPKNISASKRPNFDLNRAMVLTDSLPISTTHLDIIETRLLSVQKNGHLEYKLKANNEPLCVHVEAIKPKSIFRLKMRRDLRILTGFGAARTLGLHQNRYSSLMSRLVEYCRLASDQLLEEEILFYHSHCRPDLESWFVEKRDLQNKANPNVFLLPIGWGSGFDTKAITDLLEANTFKEVTKTYKNTSGLGYPGQNPDMIWLGPFDAPKSRKVALRSDKITGEVILEPMGWVAVRIEDKNSSAIQEEWQRLVNQSTAPKRNYESARPEPNLRKSVSEEPIQPQPSSRLVLKFDSLPEIDDLFYGHIFSIERDGIYLEIPGLTDDMAYAWLESPKSRRKFVDGQLILCRVVEILSDPIQPNIKRIVSNLV